MFYGIFLIGFWVESLKGHKESPLGSFLVFFGGVAWFVAFYVCFFCGFDYISFCFEALLVFLVFLCLCLFGDVFPYKCSVVSCLG